MSTIRTALGSGALAAALLGGAYAPPTAPAAAPAPGPAPTFAKGTPIAPPVVTADVEAVTVNVAGIAQRQIVSAYSTLKSWRAVDVYVSIQDPYPLTAGLVQVYIYGVSAGGRVLVGSGRLGNGYEPAAAGQGGQNIWTAAVRGVVAERFDVELTCSGLPGGSVAVTPLQVTVVASNLDTTAPEWVGVVGASNAMLDGTGLVSFAWNGGNAVRYPTITRVQVTNLSAAPLYLHHMVSNAGAVAFPGLNLISIPAGTTFVDAVRPADGSAARALAGGGSLMFLSTSATAIAVPLASDARWNVWFK